MLAKISVGSDVSSSEHVGIQSRIAHYESQCACGIAMVLGWIVPGLVLTGSSAGVWTLPSDWPRYVMLLVSSVFVGVVVGKIGGGGYYAIRARLLRRVIKKQMQN